MVSSGRELISFGEQSEPDMIVAAIPLASLIGHDFQNFTTASRKIRVVLLRPQPDANPDTGTLETDAAALRNSAAEEILAAIREATRRPRNRVSVPPSCAAESEGNSAFRQEESAVFLRPRQREILHLIAEGKTLKEIGGLLHLSPRTVEFHKYRLMEKLRLRTTGELIQYAVKHGLAGN